MNGRPSLYLDALQIGPIIAPVRAGIGNDDFVRIRVMYRVARQNTRIE